LGKTFGCEIKGFFPLKIINDPAISLDYEGEVPPLKYFYHPHPLNVKAYKKYVNKYNEFKLSYIENNKKRNLAAKMNLRNIVDVIVLHNVLVSFTKEIYTKFEINVLKYPTLPSPLLFLDLNF
jgi:hypothetical protein